MEVTELTLGNYYGCLNIAKHEGKFYWIIENWGSDMSDISEWDEIPESLYNEILKKHNG